jgi:uncharacterized protein (PEP-CTERM system associated)
MPAPDQGIKPVFKLLPLALGALLLSAECHAQWRVAPRIDLRETYSDNVGLQNSNDARSSFVSEADPSISISRNGPRLKVNADAGWRLYSYSNDDVANLQNSERHYSGALQAVLVDQLLFVDANAGGSRQAISAFGPVSNNTFSNTNRTDIRTWRISPYLRHRFGSRADLTLRYMRDSVDSGVGGYGTSMASTRVADLSSGTAFDALGWNLSYYHQDLNERLGNTGGMATLANDSMSENTTAGLRWRLIRRFALTANVGYDKYEYPTLGEATNGRSWSGGFIWTPSSRTSVQATFGRRYFGKTGSLVSSYRTPRSIWNLNYSDAVTTTRSQFVLPSAIDTAAMLDSLFAASIPDPVQRQQAVQAYIAATGLPPTLANSINYLSNRYIRIQRLQGAAIFRGSRSNLTFSVYNEKRLALSTQESDSALLLGQLASLNDNTSQRGASANLDYRLSSRSNAYGNLSVSRVRSLSADFSSNNSEMRLGLNHRFAPKMQGSVELRHTRGRQNLVNADTYRENALVATLSVVY